MQKQPIKLSWRGACDKAIVSFEDAILRRESSGPSEWQIVGAGDREAMGLSDRLDQGPRSRRVRS